VGAGVSTVLMLGTLALTTNEEKINSKSRTLPAAILSLVTGAVLIYGTSDMPSYGDANAPVHLHVVPRYLNNSLDEVGIPNVVTSVLATYRGYDTLGEAFVVFTAALGVLAIIGRRRRRRKKADIELEAKA
jgi:multicomponent Na+:H+ antiporter subunit B